MSISPTRQPSFTNRVFGAVAAVSAAGMIGLAVTAVVGFEEPNDALLLTSFILMLVAPVATLVHLARTANSRPASGGFGSDSSQVIGHQEPFRVPDQPRPQRDG